MRKPIVVETKVKLSDGRTVRAILIGDDGGDLHEGIIRMKGKKVLMDDLPRELFPIEPTEETPFIDFRF